MPYSLLRSSMKGVLGSKKVQQSLSENNAVSYKQVHKGLRFTWTTQKFFDPIVKSIVKFFKGHTP